jgi:hypothetical protein
MANLKTRQMFVAIYISLMNASQVAALFLMSRSSTQKLEMRPYFASVYSAVIQITLVRFNTAHAFSVYIRVTCLLQSTGCQNLSYDSS